MKQQPHGLRGHANIYVRDQDSDLTNYGKHNRLLVFRSVDRPSLITIREDIKHGLAMSTEEDRQRVAKGWKRLHPKSTSLMPVSVSNRHLWRDGSTESIEYCYLVSKRGVPVDIDVISLKTVVGKFTMWPKAMDRNPSDRPEDWLKFQKEHVPGAELDAEEQERLQAFMRRYRTEALTNGNAFYTLAGGMLAYCDPAAIQ